MFKYQQGPRKSLLNTRPSYMFLTDCIQKRDWNDWLNEDFKKYPHNTVTQFHVYTCLFRKPKCQFWWIPWKNEMYLQYCIAPCVGYPSSYARLSLCFHVSWLPYYPAFADPAVPISPVTELPRSNNNDGRHNFNTYNGVMRTKGFCKSVMWMYSSHLLEA